MTIADHSSQPIRVLLVDDVAIIRSLIKRAIDPEDGIEVVATAQNGQAAIDAARTHQPDIIILDIEMPVMDGLTALPEILKAAPKTRVIMSSTLTLQNAEVSLKALSLGATDYLSKPESREDKDADTVFFQTLIQKIRALASRHTPAAKPAATPAVKKVMAALPPRIDAVAIASSTGGPPALTDISPLFKSMVARVPFFITQHMPAKFTTILATHLTRDSGIPCVEGQNGMVARAGTIYIAPGDYHMTPRRQDDNVTIHLNQNPPVNFCRPAADPMIEALIECYGQHLLIVVLTGMGSDGANACKSAAAMGCPIIVQDKETSIVWGMPGAVADAGLADKILPLNDIPHAMASIMKVRL